MPLCVYHDINDESVTPRQHIIRAFGGPLFNLLVLPIALIFRSLTHPRSFARDVANAAVGTNIFLPVVGLVPLPGIDGGAILKWSLVEKGLTQEEADLGVRKVDGVLGPLFAIAGFFSFKNRRWLIGGLFAQFSLIAIAVALGIFKEQE